MNSDSDVRRDIRAFAKFRAKCAFKAGASKQVELIKEDEK